MFGLETCGKAEEISFPSSDNVTSFLMDVIRLEGQRVRVPCVNLDFMLGGKAIWSFKFFESI